MEFVFTCCRRYTNGLENKFPDTRPEVYPPGISMKAIGQRVAGQLLLHGGQNALILHDNNPAADEMQVVILRYALVVRGPGDHIFPSLLLDDWGREISSLKLYSWIREYGESFPRGEIFGFEADGTETQAFLREMELMARYPCYAYRSETEPVEQGHLLTAILLPDPECREAKQLQRPAEISFPLSVARVSWWAVPASSSAFDFRLLDEEPDPGY
jgi:hypothetical protein